MEPKPSMMPGRDAALPMVPGEVPEGNRVSDLPFEAHVCLVLFVILAGVGGGLVLVEFIEDHPDNYVAGGALALVCFCAAGCCVRRRCKAQRQLRELDLELAEAGPSPADSRPAASTPAVHLELKEGDVIMDKALKRGNFGEVWRGQLAKTGEVVAVKVLPPNTRSVMGSDDLIAEINVMRHLRDKGSHPNVMDLKGYSLQMPPQLVLEFIETGSLEDFLKTMRENELPMEEPVAKDFALQIARGMKFVADAGIVHRDLASRNVLITGDNVLKVCDFGLARVVGQAGFFDFKPRGYCIKKKSNPTAFRWTPPESYKEIALSAPSEQVPHTERGDVWAFAVVMMEICSRAELPYEADIKGSNKELVMCFVLDGKRMSQGPMPDGMYSLALRCWEHEPEDRPNFAAVIRELDGKSRQTKISFLGF